MYIKPLSAIIHSHSIIHHSFADDLQLLMSAPPNLFITFTCNPQWPEIEHSLFSNQQSQESPDSIFHLLLSKLHDKCATLAEPLFFLNMIDIGTLNLYQHHLVLVLLVYKMPNGSMTPNMHGNTVFLLKCRTNFVKKMNES